MTIKTNIYLNHSLLSGSTDKLRNHIGGFWHLPEGSADYTFLANAVTDPNTTEMAADDFGTMNSGLYPTKLANISFDTIDTWEAVNSQLILPSTKLRMMLIGSEEEFTNDEEWSTYVLGGKLPGLEEYKGVLSTGIETDNHFSMNLPYELLQAKRLYGSNYGTTEHSVLQVEYNMHLAEYQQKKTSIKLRPNFYTMRSTWTSDVMDSLYGEGLRTYVTLGGSQMTDSPEMMASADSVVWNNSAIATESWLPAIHGYNYNQSVSTPGYYIDPYYHSLRYFLRSSATEYSEQVVNYIETKMQNIFLASPDGGGGTADWLIGEDALKVVPYYINLSMPHMSSNTYNSDTDLRKALDESKFTNILLSSLKKYFVDSNNFIPSTQKLNTIQEYHILEEVDNASEPPANPTSKKLSTVQTLQYVDLGKIIIDEISGNVSEDENFLFLSSDPLEVDLINATHDSDRHIRSARAINFLDKIKGITEEKSEAMGVFPFPRPEWDSGTEWNIGDFLNGAFSAMQIEDTVAYRIEKIGLATAENVATNTVLQNYFVSAPLEDSSETGIQLCDSRAAMCNSG